MSRAQVWILGVILMAAAALNFWNIGFPLGYHIDEPVKVANVLEGTQNFNHPVLMLQLARTANAVLGFRDPQSVVVLGRSILAAGAVGTVLVVFFLARRQCGPLSALGAAASAAVSPTLVIHAHYLKEDALVTLGLMASLLAFVRYLERPNAGRLAMLGIASGLAMSSHYKAALLIPLFAMAPALGVWPSVSDRPARQVLGAYYLDLLRAGIAAAVVFLIVNWPLFGDIGTFWSGAMSEVHHAIEGEDARIRPADFWMAFHLRFSLAPGMSWPVLATGLAGLAWVVTRWRRESAVQRVLVAFAVLFYFVQEISPLRPPPDFSRYVLPVVPVLICLAWSLVSRIAASDVAFAGRVVAVASIAALIVVPAYSTVRLVDGMGDDSRARAAVWLRDHAGAAIVEQYAGLSPNVWTASEIDLAQARRDGVVFIVTSSFMFDRYALGSRLPNQSAEMYRRHEGYQELFRHPFVEIAPAYGGFGFTNPVIRIVDIRKGTQP